MAKPLDPRVHSVYHLFSAAVDKLYRSGRSVAAHVENKRSRCDYLFDHIPAREEIEAIENAVNTAIERDLPVSSELMDKTEAARLFSLAKLPREAPDQIRIVRIGDYDACPCDGEHVPSTRAIGRFCLLLHDWKDGVLRLRFKIYSLP